MPWYLYVVISVGSVVGFALFTWTFVEEPPSRGRRFFIALLGCALSYALLALTGPWEGSRGGSRLMNVDYFVLVAGPGFTSWLAQEISARGKKEQE